MDRIVQARACASQALRLFQRARAGTAGETEAKLDAAIAHLDLELEARELGTDSAAVEDPTRPEWQEGWPRGTWVESFGIVFDVFWTARDPEGSLMYLVPASYFGLSAPPARWITVYAATVNEARLADGRVFTRLI